jgi:hypothetical protein
MSARVSTDKPTRQGHAAAKLIGLSARDQWELDELRRRRKARELSQSSVTTQP